MGGLSEQEKDHLILAFFDPGDDCTHNMTPAFAEIEAIVARHVAAALTEAADDVLTEFDPPIEACIWASEWLRDRAARMSSH